MAIATLKLNASGEYVFGGNDQVAANVSRCLESKGLSLDQKFDLQVLGLRVVGHTLRDGHGRMAMEFEAVTLPGDHEDSITSTGASWSPTERKLVKRKIPTKALRPAKKAWWKCW